MISVSDVTDVLYESIDQVLTSDKVSAIIAKLYEKDDEWEPMEVSEDQLGSSMSIMCKDICLVAQQQGEYEIRFLRRKK